MANQRYNLKFLGSNIFRLRSERSWTREYFAELIGVSSRMVYDWESGLSTPKMERLFKIASAFGETLDSMFTSL